MRKIWGGVVHLTFQFLTIPLIINIYKILHNPPTTHYIGGIRVGGIYIWCVEFLNKWGRLCLTSSFSKEYNPGSFKLGDICFNGY